MLAVYFATLEKVMISSIFPLLLRDGPIEPYGFSGIALNAAPAEPIGACDPLHPANMAIAAQSPSAY
jgi:hypothetical protein